MPGICKHVIPRKLRDQGKEKQISAVIFSVSGMGKAFQQKKTENRKCNPSDIPADTVRRISVLPDTKKRSQGWRIL